MLFCIVEIDTVCLILKKGFLMQKIDIRKLLIVVLFCIGLSLQGLTRGFTSPQVYMGKNQLIRSYSTNRLSSERNVNLNPKPTIIVPKVSVPRYRLASVNNTLMVNSSVPLPLKKSSSGDMFTWRDMWSYFVDSVTGRSKRARAADQELQRVKKAEADYQIWKKSENE